MEEGLSKYGSLAEAVRMDIQREKESRHIVSAERIAFGAAVLAPRIPQRVYKIIGCAVRV